MQTRGSGTRQVSTDIRSSRLTRPRSWRNPTRCIAEPLHIFNANVQVVSSPSSWLDKLVPLTRFNTQMDCASLRTSDVQRPSVLQHWQIFSPTLVSQDNHALPVVLLDLCLHIKRNWSRFLNPEAIVKSFESKFGPALSYLGEPCCSFSLRVIWRCSEMRSYSREPSLCVVYKDVYIDGLL